MVDVRALRIRVDLQARQDCPINVRDALGWHYQIVLLTQEQRIDPVILDCGCQPSCGLESCFYTVVRSYVARGGIQVYKERIPPGSCLRVQAVRPILLRRYPRKSQTALLAR